MKLLHLILVALLLTGCITEYNAILPENDKKILFVDGSIIENTDVTFCISQSFTLDIDEIHRIPEESFINNANLNIIGSNGYKSPPAINQGKGTYRISIGKLDDDVEYGILIEFNGDIYQSALSKPLYTPEIDSISWVQPDSAGIVSFYLSTHDDMEGTKFFMWNYTEDWEIRSVYPTTVFYNPDYKAQMQDPFYLDNSEPYYYCWKKNESSLVGSTESLNENRIIDQLLYEHSSESDRFSMLYSITVTQRVISKGAYEYHQNQTKLNEEMGGLFTPQPSEIIGNITCITNPSNKIMGYVETVKNIRQKRIFVYPEQLKRPVIHSSCGHLPQVDLPMEEAYAHYYRLGFRPAMLDLVAYSNYGVVGPSQWALSHCTDCRANGGTKNKPDFWPNWHE